MRNKLSEETVKRLPVPEKGNCITYFAGDTIQGAKAPRGFGVRVTAAGARLPPSRTRASLDDRRLAGLARSQSRPTGP